MRTKEGLAQTVGGKVTFGVVWHLLAIGLLNEDRLIKEVMKSMILR